MNSGKLQHMSKIDKVNKKNGNVKQKVTEVLTGSTNPTSPTFAEIYIDIAKNTKNTRHDIEQLYVRNQGFKTHHGNDISYNLLTNAEALLTKEIRKQSADRLKQYVKYDYISMTIESGLFEFALIQIIVNNSSHHFVHNIYQDKLQDICDNLDVTNTHIENTTLLPIVMEGSINPYFIAFLTPYQLHPKRWTDIMTKQLDRESIANALQTTDIYTCSKCKESKFKITELQLRCADEPMSKMCVCTICYHTFII